MSRLKRQRVDADGQDRVTASTGDFENSTQRQEANNEQDKEISGRSLFVHSLPSSTTTESLEIFFSQSFPVKHATVVLDPESKESKGYGFVTFADVEDARGAREAFHQSMLDGRKIKVEFAEPRHRLRRGGDSAEATTHTKRANRSKPEFQPSPKLIIRNLPWTIKNSDQLATLFRSYGKVKHATMPTKKPGLSAGFGFVVLRGRKNAEKALEAVNGKEVDGRTLAVDWAVEKEVWENNQSREQVSSPDDLNTNGNTAIKEYASIAAEESQSSESEGDALSDMGTMTGNESEDSTSEGEASTRKANHAGAESDSSTLFVRNLPFICTDEMLKDHFRGFGAVRYARVVLDPATERSRGTGFVSFFNPEHANLCLREAPRIQPPAGSSAKGTNASITKQSLLEDPSNDSSGRYTLDGRVLQVSKAVDRKEATRLTYAGHNLRDERDKDKRRLYLLSEGTVPSTSPLYSMLSSTELKIREDSAKQRQSLIRSNPSLHLSLTRLSIRNLPRNITSKDLKALAREAVVGFAKDVKGGLRMQLSKEELSRGGEDSREAERTRKAKGKGVVKQAKIVYEGREGGKVGEESGAGRSRGYGFIEYSSHRWALMGLRWLNGHGVDPSKGTASGSMIQERKKRLIVEFAIENAQVVARRREREAKARDRLMAVSQQREKGEKVAPVSARLSKDQLMAKTRRGQKEKRNSAHNTPDTPVSSVANDKLEKGSKRQQIIGRKRMMRRLRKKPSSG